MKIEFANAPASNSTPKQDLRAKAIAKFMGQSPEATEPKPEALTDPGALQVEPKSVNAPQGQPDTIEAKVDAPPAPEAPAAEPQGDDAPLSAQYAQLARKEKALRAKVQAQEAAYRQREEALRQREEALKGSPEGEAAPQTIDVADLMADPLGTLERMGLNYDKLTERALQPGMDPATKAYLAKLEAKIASLETETKGTKQSIEQQQAGQYQQAVAQIRSEAQALVKNDPNFETIRETDSVGDVVELIEKTFREGLDDERPKGTLLTVQEAAQMIEDELSERLISYATKINKVKSKFQVAPPVDKAPTPPAKQDAGSTEKPQTQMKTLTNAHGTSRPLTARERAIRAFRGEKF